MEAQAICQSEAYRRTTFVSFLLPNTVLLQKSEQLPIVDKMKLIFPAPNATRRQFFPSLLISSGTCHYNANKVCATFLWDAF